MDLEQYKKVISEAIKDETKAKEFYESVAERIKNENLKDLFKKFAHEEAQHEKILRAILNQNKMDTSSLNFEKDFKISETIDIPEVNDSLDLKSAIGIAMKNEEIAMKKYLTLAESCSDKELKKVFQDLASMERSHKFKMEESFVDIGFTEVW